MTKKARSLRIIATAAVFSTAACFSTHVIAGQPFPRWDMREFCSTRVPPDAVQDCINVQVEAREKVRIKWPMLTADEQGECMSYIENDEILPSYMRLDHCVDLELKAR